MRRQKGGYFQVVEGAPTQVEVCIEKRVQFSDADVMGVVWHGNYARYFEEAAGELGRKCELSYKEFHDARIQAPIVQFHVDYHQPLMLGETIKIKAAFVWSEGARLHTEFSVLKENGTVAATGYTVQMFIDAISGDVLLTVPDLLERCRARWAAGDFS
jgi:acyl-CoA thioester hydrolase